MTLILAYPRQALRAQLSDNIVPFDGTLLPQGSLWREREILETDAECCQIIPYAILTRDNQIWAYRRRGGDARLDGRCSIGVGGHVDACDNRGAFISTIRAALQRELSEELARAPDAIPEFPLAWINEQESAIGRVHIGLLFQVPWQAEQPPKVAHDEKLEGLGFLPSTSITRAAGFEYWSELAAQVRLN